MTDRVSEAELAALDERIAGAFGRGPAVGDQDVSLFRDAGLCEESALAAAKGLREGVFFSFEDAALSVASAWGADNDAHRRRVANRAATPERIAEVAQRLPEHLRVQEQA